jgi:predicted nucleic acid-binding protein
MVFVTSGQAFGRTSVLLDTTFFIDLYRGDPSAAEVFNGIFAGEALGDYSPITAFELWSGRLLAVEEDFYEAILAHLSEATLTTGAAKRAGAWLRGLPAPTNERLTRDALIAATAEELHQSICTRNVRDFQRFPVDLLPY